MDATGRYRVDWVPDRVVRGIPNDTPILGYRVNTVNMLRLWQAEACTSLDLQAFNVGDYTRACEEQVHTENITKVLYPNDESEAGKVLRLQQEYFFVSCSLQDMIRIYLQREKTMDNFDKKYAVQLNDTHPALTIAELMRLLVDEHDMDWDKAWGITSRTMSYTNHTLLPEALESWPLPLFQRVLPRHLEIIMEINRRFLSTVEVRFPKDEKRMQRMSLIDERGDRRVRMANLACVGSHAVNGVAQIHSDLLKQTVLHDFAELWPEKFTNVTNGVTPRRFLLLANPTLASLITEVIGDGWPRDLGQLRGLEKFCDDAAFHDRWRQVKLINKQALADYVQQANNIELLPDTMFDVQVKRIHEYKRQHLNVLRAVALYRHLKRGGDAPPRTLIFGGKAAPGYHTAKLIIKLIHGVAEVVNADRKTNDRLRIAFLPDLNVKNAQRIYPAADLSEQISTAGMEASGTGNMKFAMNGAMTIGTLDGANVEIREEVGPENFFLFGMTVSEVQQRQAAGYRPWEFYEKNAELREVLDSIARGDFSRGDRTLFAPLVRALLDRDPFMLCADFQAYMDCQAQVGEVYAKQQDWTRMSILNTARMGKFSSDRAIAEYCERIWHVSKVKVALRPPSASEK
jgi:starch phosphorylase